jgi:hypothetical protein
MPSPTESAVRTADNPPAMRKLVLRLDSIVRMVMIGLVGLGSLGALALIAAILAASLGTPPLAGYAVVHTLEVMTLLLTLALVGLAWARFIIRTRRRSA